MKILLFLCAAAFGAALPPMPAQAPETVEPSQSVRAGEQAEIVISLKLPKGWRLHPKEKFLYRISEFVGSGHLKVDEARRKGLLEKPKFPIKIPLIPPAGKSAVVVQAAFYYCPKKDLDRCKAFSRYYRIPMTSDEGAPASNQLPLLIEPASD